MRKPIQFDNPYLKEVERREKRRKILLFSLLLGLCATIVIVLVTFVFPSSLDGNPSEANYRYKTFNPSELDQDKVTSFLKDPRNVILIELPSQMQADTVRSVEDYIANSDRYIAMNNMLVDLNDGNNGNDGEDNPSFEDDGLAFVAQEDDNTEENVSPVEPPERITPPQAEPVVERNDNDNATTSSSSPLTNNPPPSSSTQGINSSISITGDRKAGSAMSFNVANLDPKYYYEIDLGNGVLQPIIKDLKYTFSSSGAYNIVLYASGPNTLATVVDSTRLIIEGSPEPEQIAESTPPVSPPADEKVVREADLISEAGGNGTASDGEPVFSAQKMPQFPGGVAAMYEYLSRSIQIPEGSDAEGTVFVRFIVDAEGNISQPQIIRGLTPQINAAVLRVIDGMPKWMPAMNNGEIVPAYKGISIRISKRS